ncbi:hypothetical protein EB796_001359 [Bugula neritina]|uniref:Uncharacterized protein n=1 Tax=Bugula neritina TaxID=10212 RepID=A0A7J7KQ60_BUGNE|nr:hypothetical protein EB796_001359 [Bugula neritina]
MKPLTSCMKSVPMNAHTAYIVFNPILSHQFTIFYLQKMSNLWALKKFQGRLAGNILQINSVQKRSTTNITTRKYWKTGLNNLAIGVVDV